MIHIEAKYLNGNITCTCRQVFSEKGFPIHQGMMHRKLEPDQRKVASAAVAKAAEARRVERKSNGAWPRGMLFNPNDLPDLPQNKAERDERQCQLDAERKRLERRFKAEQRHEDHDFAKILQPYLKAVPSAALGKEIRNVLYEYDWCVHRCGDW